MGDTTVFLVDDHKMIREGLKAMIATEPGLKVVGEAVSGEDALDAYLDVCPDVVIMDVNMPGIDGVETTRRLMQKDPNARIVGLSMYSDNQTARRFREAGCLGFVTKSAPFNDLVLAIRAASAGLSFPDDDCLGASTTGTTPKEDIGLTLREQEVLSLIGQGLSAEELAAQMDVSVSTVASHRRSIMSKLRLHSGLGGAN